MVMPQSITVRTASPVTDLEVATVADSLAAHDGEGTRALSHRLGWAQPRVRAVLLDMEDLGIVYRTGRTKGTRWWLG